MSDKTVFWTTLFKKFRIVGIMLPWVDTSLQTKIVSKFPLIMSVVCAVVAVVMYLHPF